ncbi:MAG: SEC-C metal-binding domain-containing protein [Tidjanibacter sp.]|nr:SEC-C metal-binding domain-containing protein [Tidjanibacter sp.]
MAANTHSSKQETKIHALTNCYPGIANSIITPVEIKNLETGEVYSTNGIWDTGASGSVITKSVADALKLDPKTQIYVNGISGPMLSNVYYAEITLNNKNISIFARVTECAELSTDKSVGMLIGMNIINKGDFVITNFNEQTVMSFRVPSMQKVDFVEGLHENKPAIANRTPRPNDTCMCGSGKKFKKCCGKR